MHFIIIITITIIIIIIIIIMYGKVRSELIDKNSKEIKTQNVQISWHFICLQLYVTIYGLSWFKNDILKKKNIISTCCSLNLLNV